MSYLSFSVYSLTRAINLSCLCLFHLLSIKSCLTLRILLALAVLAPDLSGLDSAWSLIHFPASQIFRTTGLALSFLCCLCCLVCLVSGCLVCLVCILCLVFIKLLCITKINLGLDLILALVQIYYTSQQVFVPILFLFWYL